MTLGRVLDGGNGSLALRSALTGEVWAHRQQLRPKARQMTRNHAGAEDLVQEPLVKALTLSPRLRPRTNLAALLLTVMTRAPHCRQRRHEPVWLDLAADLLARSQVHARSTGGSAGPDTLGMVPDPAADAWRSLPPNCQVPVYRSSVEGHTCRDVAEHVGVVVGAVKVRV